MSMSTTGTGGVQASNASAATTAERAQPAPPAPVPGAGEPDPPKKSIKGKLLLAGGVWIGGVIALVAIYGFKGTRNTDFEPQNEFKLDSWIHLGVFSINKAVLYLLIAAVATCVSMIWIARRMQERPSKVQGAVEVVFVLMRDNSAGGGMEERRAAEWCPCIGALFV